MSYENYVNTKEDRYRELGLTDDEIFLIMSPVSSLDKEGIRMGFLVKDKINSIIEKRNEEYSIKKLEIENKKTFAEKIGLPTVRAVTVV